VALDKPMCRYFDVLILMIKPWLHSRFTVLFTELLLRRWGQCEQPVKCIEDLHDAMSVKSLVIQ